jgi:DNA-binding MarR family transcriptional regulator
MTSPTSTTRARSARRASSVDEIGRGIEGLLRLHASRRVHAKRTAVAGVPLSVAGAVALQHIAEAGSLSLRELGNRAEMDPAVATRQVRVLEADGLVRRRSEPGDRRVVLVSLTPAGRRAQQRITAVKHQHLDDVLGRWSEADRRRFGDLLGRFVDDLRGVDLRGAEPDEEPP